jgi:hypothetical protein
VGCGSYGDVQWNYDDDDAGGGCMLLGYGGARRGSQIGLHAAASEAESIAYHQADAR